MRRSVGVMLICFLVMVVVDANPVHATSYDLLVTAWGDNGAIGNSGVGVEILTRSYAIPSSDNDHAFWVGDNLANGGFIQFGYALQQTNYYCLYGRVVGGYSTCSGSTDYITNGNARWFWEYFPNIYVADYYYGTGVSNLADGTWHTYQILP